MCHCKACVWGTQSHSQPPGWKPHGQAILWRKVEGAVDCGGHRSYRATGSMKDKSFLSHHICQASWQQHWVPGKKRKMATQLTILS